MTDQARLLGVATVNLHYWSTGTEEIAAMGLVNEVAESMKSLDALCLQEVQYEWEPTTPMTGLMHVYQLGTSTRRQAYLVGTTVRRARQRILAAFGLSYRTKLFIYRGKLSAEPLPQDQIYPPPGIDPSEFPEFCGGDINSPGAAAQAVLDSPFPEGSACTIKVLEEPSWGGTDELIPGTLIYELSRALDMPYAVFMCAGDPAFGNCILSRLPLLSVRLWPLPFIGNGWWTGRPCICAELDTSSLRGGEACPSVFLVAVHLDHRNEDSRMDQVCEVVRQIRECGLLHRPLLIGGDFNSITHRDYTPRQLEENDGRRRRVGLDPARFDVTSFLEAEGFLDTLWQDPACPGTGHIHPTVRYKTRVDYLFCTRPLGGTVERTITRDMQLTDHAAYMCFLDLARVKAGGPDTAGQRAEGTAGEQAS